MRRTLRQRSEPGPKGRAFRAVGVGPHGTEHSRELVEERVQVVNVLGLHARAAARFVRTATRFRSEVTITKDGTTTDGKSILGILFLAASMGSEIVIAASGEDEREALAALVELVAGGLGDEGQS